MFRDSFWGLQGFDDLRRFIKHGNEFCREVAAILQERSDGESSYAKTLSKLSGKLGKLANNSSGTLAETWSLAATEMESEAELHRQLSQSLHDDVYKPMKNFADTQAKTRKPIESMVDKSLKHFLDKRNDEARTKKCAFTCAKDREKLCDAAYNAKNSKGKPVSEKDLARLDKKVRQIEDSLRKADRDYYDTSQKAETARQEWETCVYKGATQMQALEEERISYMQDFLNKYNNHLSVIGPKLVMSCEKLGEGVLSVDVNSDLRKAIDQKGTGPNQPEQILPDYYAQDLSNSMESDRRRQALRNYMIYVQQDLEKELKGKEGVEKLVEVYHNRPSFADAEAQEEARQRLSHVSAMLNYLEASHHMFSASLAELENRPKPVSKFSQYIERNKDKQGQQTSILRLPLAKHQNGFGPQNRDSVYRPPADGGQSDPPYAALKGLKRNAPAAPASADQLYDNVIPETAYTEPRGRKSQLVSVESENSFSSFQASQAYPNWGQYEEDDEFDTPEAICQCRVLYDYVGRESDELTIHPGDTITVFEKQEDGWWQGELGGKMGIFPATYVEEIPGTSRI